MKKRIPVFLFALVIIASLVLAGCTSTNATTTPPQTTSSTAPTTAPASTAPTAANTITLKYADQNPDTGWEGSHAAQPWLDQITKATNSRVKFETYYSQSLFKGTDAWVSTKNGVADAAWMFHGYRANMTPLADVLSLTHDALQERQTGQRDLLAAL